MTTLDYPTFDDVKNPTHGSWNRLNSTLNMKEFFTNSNMAHNYLKKFSHKDQIELAKLSILISKNGYENTRRSIIRGNNV